jgi:hypothetical protein
VIIDGQYQRENEGDQRASIGAKCGTEFAIKGNGFGSHVGVDYDPLLSASVLTAEISFTPHPVDREDHKKIELKVALSTDSLFVDGTSDALYISIRAVQSHEELIDHWTLTIYRNEKYSSRPVKIFLGGGIPPSTVRFDGRDNQGQLLPAGRYSAQLNVVSVHKEVVFSPISFFQIQ